MRRSALREDCRAAATIALEHDARDRGRRIECPLLLLWGARSVVDERPQETLDALREFVARDG